MNTLLEILESRLLTALSKAGVEVPVGFPVKIFAAADVRHGDYQANTAMALAKRLKMNPRELAAQLVEALEVDDLAELEIAGPGFINFRIKPEAWAGKVGQMINDPRLGVGRRRHLAVAGPAARLGRRAAAASAAPTRHRGGAGF